MLLFHRNNELVIDTIFEYLDEHTILRLAGNCKWIKELVHNYMKLDIVEMKYAPILIPFGSKKVTTQCGHEYLIHVELGILKYLQEIRPHVYKLHTHKLYTNCCPLMIDETINVWVLKLKYNGPAALCSFIKFNERNYYYAVNNSCLGLVKYCIYCDNLILFISPTLNDYIIVKLIF